MSGCGLAPLFRGQKRPTDLGEVVHAASQRMIAPLEGPNGVRISNIPFFARENGAFVALLPKPTPVQEGTHARPGGGPQYSPIREWRDRSLADESGKAVVVLSSGSNCRRRPHRQKWRSMTAPTTRGNTVVGLVAHGYYKPRVGH